ncbi:GDSL-type esterase/lipase family protein [Paenibacillus sp. Z6-24]
MLHIINHYSDQPVNKITDSFFSPVLHLYLTESAAPCPCMLILPGGGYHHLAEHEGEPVARWLNTLGIHAAVLEYSTFDSLSASGSVSEHHHISQAEAESASLQTDEIKTPVETEDLKEDSRRISSFAKHTDPAVGASHPLIDPGERLQETEAALRLLRQHAGEWHILTEQIGLIGFSAGGHLAALTAVMGRIRPHLLMLSYPVITFREPHAHQGSRLQFLGEQPHPAMINRFSAEQQVDKSVPPAFIWATADDASVPVENSLLFSQALSAHRIPHELHIMESGRHGLGLAQEHPYCHQWTELAANWLQRHLSAPLTQTLPGMDAAQRRPTLFIAGDSTAAIKGASEKPMSGWGEYMAEHFGGAVIVDNRAINGRSTRSFLAEGRLDHIAADLQAGDYLLIQFGHNDEKSADPARYTDPDTDYRSNLRQFIDTARQHGAIPVLLTSVSRRRFLPDGTPDPLSVGLYPEAMKQTAAAADVPLLDLFTASQQLYAALGESGSRKLFMHLPPGQHPNYMDGIADDTHFSVHGAQAIAELAVSAILQHPALTALHKIVQQHNRELLAR